MQSAQGSLNFGRPLNGTGSAAGTFGAPGSNVILTSGDLTQGDQLDVQTGRIRSTGEQGVFITPQQRQQSRCPDDACAQPFYTATLRRQINAQFGPPRVIETQVDDCGNIVSQINERDLMISSTPYFLQPGECPVPVGFRGIVDSYQRLGFRSAI